MALINFFQAKKFLLVFIFVLLISFFLRIWQLDSIPPGLYPDEAINGNEAYSTLKSGVFQVFYPENNGREGLYINFIAFSFNLLGPSIFALRLTSVLLGILTVFVIFFLAKIFFNREIALLSSALLGFSYWHLSFSRLGFRAILVPLILTLALYFLIKGFKSRKLDHLVISGFFWGLGFYSYISFRLAYFFLFLIFVYLLFKNRDNRLELKFYLKSFLIIISILFIVVAPLLLYFIYYPEYFISRAQGVSIFAHPNIIKNFFNSLFQHLLMFNLRGDLNWRHHFSGLPMLNPLVGLFFLYGFYLSVKKIREDSKYLILIAWFFIMLLPGVLTIEGIPHSLRVVGVIPAVFILAAMGLWEFAQRYPLKKKVIIAGVLIFSFLYSFILYFFIWAKNPNVAGAFTSKFVEVGKTLNSLPENFTRVVIVNESGVPVPFPDGIPMPAQTPIFMEIAHYGKKRSYYLKPEDLDILFFSISSSRPLALIPMRDDEVTYQKLESLFPSLQKEKINNITIYVVK